MAERETQTTRTFPGVLLLLKSGMNLTLTAEFETRCGMPPTGVAM